MSRIDKCFFVNYPCNLHIPSIIVYCLTQRKTKQSRKLSLLFNHNIKRTYWLLLSVLFIQVTSTIFHFISMTYAQHKIIHRKNIIALRQLEKETICHSALHYFPKARINNKKLRMLKVSHETKTIANACFQFHYLVVHPIFYYRKGTQMSISGSIAARGLKFWLQVGLGPPIATPWTEIRKSGSGSGKSGFSGIFFSLFSLLWTSWDLRVTPGCSRTT